MRLTVFCEAIVLAASENKELYELMKIEAIAESD